MSEDTLKKAMLMSRLGEELARDPSLSEVSRGSIGRVKQALSAFMNTLRPDFQANAAPQPSPGVEALRRVLPLDRPRLEPVPVPTQPLKSLGGRRLYGKNLTPLNGPDRRMLAANDTDSTPSKTSPAA